MDVSDLITAKDLADLLKMSYITLYRLRKRDPRITACAISTGGRRPRYRFSRKLLREAGLITEVANAPA